MNRLANNRLAMASHVSAIMLAAGLSRRFGGGDKLLAPLLGQPLLAHTARALAASSVTELIVVTARGDEARRSALAPFTVRHVVVETAERGQGASIAAAVTAVDPGASGVLITPADMPLLDAALLDRLIGHFRATGAAKIVFPLAAGDQRPPVIWPADMFHELRRLDGDGGGKAIVARHVERSSPVVLGAREAAKLDDVDTPEDLDRMQVRRG